VRVSARRGYFAPTAELAAAAAAPHVDTGPSAVDEAIGRLASVRADPELFVAGTATTEGLRVAVELSTAVASRAAWRDGATVQAVATRSDGANASATAEIVAGGRDAVAVIPIPDASPGTWQVVVQVAGADARLEQRVEVAASGARLVGQATAWRGMPSPRVALRPLADARLTRMERLRVEWPVIAPADSHVARLLDRTGQPLGQPLPFANIEPEKRVLAIDLPMGSLPEGDYVIELVATHADESERRLLPFRVVR
jgi:hypothetical protein